MTEILHREQSQKRIRASSNRRRMDLWWPRAHFCDDRPADWIQPRRWARCHVRRHFRRIPVWVISTIVVGLIQSTRGPHEDAAFAGWVAPPLSLVLGVISIVRSRRCDRLTCGDPGI